MKIELAKGDRPYFRFGSGQWGRALYRVTLYTDAWSLRVYALDSPGVPVLTGMRELHALNAILNCNNGHCIIAGNMTKLKQNSKLHLIINLVTDLPQSRSTCTSTTTTTTSQSTLQDRVVQMRRKFNNKKVLFCGVMDMNLDGEIDDGKFVMTVDRHDAQHLSVSREQLNFLVGDSFCGSGQQGMQRPRWRAELVHWLNGAESRHSGDDPRGGRGSSSSGAREDVHGEDSYDHTRTMTEDLRDPRVSRDSWPCYGQHVDKRGGNRYGQWKYCNRCDLRLTYTPATNAPATSTATVLPTNVTEAIAALRPDVAAKDMTCVQMRAMIKIVAARKQLTKVPPSKGSSKDSSKSKEKTRPASKPAAETEELSSEEETGFEKIDPDPAVNEKENDKKTRQRTRQAPPEGSSSSSH